MNPINRRQLIKGAAATAAAVWAVGETHSAPATKPGKYRLLFNWDGSTIHCWGRTLFPDSQCPLTREQFVSLVFTPLDNTAVDAVLFSFGSGNVAEYQSRVLEWPGQADQFRFPESRRWHGGIEVDPQDQYRNPKSLADEGHNPPAVVIEECRRRGLAAFVSLRMNDTHDGQHPRGELPNPELPTFKRQNLHWLVETLDRWTALDYSHPQVRALKLRVIEEFFDRWDFDGIEIDWLHHTLNFPRGTEKANAHFLTDFLRQVRERLNRRAAARGRPIEIAVRVPERLEWCLLGGFDIPAWIERDLFDMLILGQGLTEMPDVQEFRSLMKDRLIPIYPSVYPYGNGYRISPDEVIRGSAANLWRDGADGLYAANWFHYGSWRNELLNEIADPMILAKKAKQYTLVHKFDVGRDIGSDYLRFNTTYQAPQVPLELDVEGGPKTVHLPVADVPSAAELWIGLHFHQPGDMLIVSLNGQPLGPARIDVQTELCTLGHELVIPAGSGLIGLPPQAKLEMRFQGVRLPVPIMTLHPGSNQVALRLEKRGPGSDKLLQVSRIELAVRPL